MAACDLPPGDVAAFLDRVCGGDADLRREVASLLEHHLPETIIRTSPADTDPARLWNVPPPETIEVDSDSHPRPPRFPPGTVLAGRYRIIAPLGRGGMGDVYRADDLKLNQAVALKFLARDRGEDPTWLRWYRNEVRLARKVTHPNVMRVYDISEAEGEVFISMEYVDGEDLAALLRRVGRLTGDKAIQVARQLCAGLGAAHDQGVLHRDLKPANVMIDGCGQVRIADFGIATLTSQAEESRLPIGTPAFMAPELFKGDAPSIRSDLYSLGAVLYETITGKEPFAAAPPGLRDREAAVRPSTIVPEIDAAFERVIMQCLDDDPRRRPDSAYAVAATLPGADPVASALAAGETPSPSMVAATGRQGGWDPRAAACCLGIALLALLVVVLLADRTFFLPQAGLKKAPAVLADKAEHIIAMLAAESGDREHRQGFAIDRGYLQHVAETREPSRATDSLPSDRAAAVCFWYRMGDEQIELPTLLGEPFQTRVVSAEPPTALVRLDGAGRLLEYRASAGHAEKLTATSQPVNWLSLFQLAGLSIEQFQSVRPIHAPPMYADSLAAWECISKADRTMPTRVEGASLRGRIVFFATAPSWDREWTGDEEGPSPALRGPSTVRSALYLLAIVGGGLLAWRNTRLGRGDRHGASKLFAFILCLGLLDWLLGERHVAVFNEEVALFCGWLARATLTAVVAWGGYFAVEPYVRRYWPQVMISWSRLLRGNFRDPLVGRDILLGGTCGILLVLVVQLGTLTTSWLGLPLPLAKLPNTTQDLGAVLGLRYKLNILITSLISSITLALAVLLIMLVMRIVMRRQWLAAAASWLLLTLLLATAGYHDVFCPWLTGGIVAAVTLLLLVRGGVFALIVGLFFWSLLVNSPITADFSAWYAPSSTLAIALAAAILVYGFRAARVKALIPWGRLLES